MTNTVHVVAVFGLPEDHQVSIEDLASAKKNQGVQEKTFTSASEQEEQLIAGLVLPYLYIFMFHGQGLDPSYLKHFIF